MNGLAPMGPPEILASHPEVTRTLVLVTPEGRLLLAASPGRARLRYGALARPAGVRRGGVCPVSADRAETAVFDGTSGSLGLVHRGSGRPAPIAGLPADAPA